MSATTGMAADELELFADAVRRATAASTGADLDRALEDLGWADALAVDERGAVATLFDAQGAAGSTSGALGLVILSALGVETPTDTAVLLPPLRSDAAPASADAVAGVGLGDVRRRSHVVLVAERDGATVTTVVGVGDLDRREVEGIDPAAGLVVVHADRLPGDVTWETAPGRWPDAAAAARRAVAHEQVGAMRTMLRLAREHALERIQFGQPIAAFQAVRHRLAESLVAIEAAEAALDGAWVDGTPLMATVAKAVAGTSARTVRRHCQQVLAGIGFTTEHDLHRFLRRSIVLDALFVDAAALTDRIGAMLIEQGELPAILPL